jgi:transglutaminase-like putative cysteine protease
VRRPDFPQVAGLLLTVVAAWLAGLALSDTGWVAGSDLPLVGAVAVAAVDLAVFAGIGSGLVLGALAAAGTLFVVATLWHGQTTATSSPAHGILSEAIFGSGALHAALFIALVASASAWLGWQVTARRRGVAGLLPVAVLFAVGILNSAKDELGPAVAFLVVSLALLLLTGFARFREEITRAGPAPDRSGDGRFVRVGSLLAAVAVSGAAVLPPLSVTDSSILINQQLTELRRLFGDPSGGAAASGFSLDVPLSASLAADPQVAFTYTVVGALPAAAPIYFRGVNLTRTVAGQWRLGTNGGAPVAAGQPIGYAESYQSTSLVRVLVQMVNRPAAAPTTLFYPGQLVSVSDPITVTQSSFGRTRGGQGLLTLDQATINGALGAGYEAVSSLSTATTTELEAAGIDYPSWARPYQGTATFGQSPYRPAATMQRIRELALRVTQGAASPYEKAAAIESYLRTNLVYTLTPPLAAAGGDAIDQFLFKAKAGYCQFFATAMGDMLRSLGIPTRLVNGFGAGTFDPKAGHYVVTESDAHTWVEVYFPGYGWIPFEPTPQGGYSPISRGPAAAPGCGGAGCDSAAVAAAAAAAATAATGHPAATAGAPRAVATGRAGSSAAGLLLLPAILTLLVGLALGLGLLRRPRSARAAWRRLQLAAALNGVGRRASDTPREFGLRLSRRFPELDGVEWVADDFGRRAYGRQPAGQPLGSIIDACRRLELELLRRSLRVGRKSP